MKVFYITIFLISIFFQQAKLIKEEKGLKKYFDQYDVEGSILIYDLNKNSYTSYNKARSEKGFLPASTYKIMNSLIALETGVIDTSTILKWNGKENRVEAWNRDHRLRSAFAVSCVPCYQEIARKIGPEKMSYYVSRANYGQMDIRPETIDNFWLEGNSRISPLEQVEFLKKLYRNDLPFSQDTMDQVKDIMIHEKGKNYLMRAKTGWTFQDGQNIGWFVGYVETKGNIYFFATNIEKPRGQEGNTFVNARKDITKQVLQDLQIL